METKKNITKTIKEFIFIGIGCSILALGITLYFLPHNLIVGGFSGLGIIIIRLLDNFYGIQIQLGLVIFLLNIPFFIIGFLKLGGKFIAKSFYATTMMSLMIYICSFLPQIETDLVLAAVFGGVVCGFGLGIVLRNFATTGGSDLVATILHNTLFKHSTVSKLIFIIDTVIIIIGLIVFGAYNAMYAIISIYITSKVIDRMLEGFDFAKIAFIISDHSEEISKAVQENLIRGVTGIKTVGMYHKNEKLTLMVVIDSKEVVKLKSLTKEIDKNSFIIVADVREVMGEGFSN